MNKRPRWKEPVFDIKKRFPNYFNVWVFRIGIITIVLLAVLVSGTNDWKVSFDYAYCPITDSGLPCEINYKPNLFAKIQTITLDQGDSWGEKPNYLGIHFKKAVFIIIGWCFLINHYLSRRKKKK